MPKSNGQNILCHNLMVKRERFTIRYVHDKKLKDSVVDSLFVHMINQISFQLFQDAYRLQLKLFLYEVKQQQLLSGVRTFLKVYSSISLGNLAKYMEVDESKLRYQDFFVAVFA